MDEQVKVQLTEAGIDVINAVERFMGKEELYFKFLFRFPEDENYGQIRQQLEAGDCRKAFEAAHTLKGVAGNLSLVQLEKILKVLVEFLRKGDIEQAKEIFSDLEKEYRSIVQALNTMRERG